jgi:tetratricopeptide (TPR) repeat protein
MPGRGAMAAGLAALAAGLVASAVVLKAGDRLVQESPDQSRVMYLRSGPVAQRLMLSFDALAADVYWMRAIQHYGRDRRSARVESRFELLEPLLNLTTSLDPHFNIAYRFGAIFLAEPPPSGPGRVDQAIALLKKGLENNPDKWQYAFDIGFIYYWYGTGAGQGVSDYEAAAQWFDEAAAMPKAPVWIRQLSAMTRAQGGDTRGARRVLQELAQSDEAWVRDVASRGLDQLTAIDMLGQLQRRLGTFVATYGRYPATWGEFIPATRRAGVPTDPAGVPFEFDPATSRIILSPKSPLHPLPRMADAR